MLNRLRERMGREEGFTLVELLVVMLILGILAAIAIPSFFSQRDKATDADAKSQARSAQTAIETYATDNGNSYALADATALNAIEETLPEAADLSMVSNQDTYTVQVDSDTGNSFRIGRDANGNTTLTCGTTEAVATGAFAAHPARGGCPSDGTW